MHFSTATVAALEARFAPWTRPGGRQLDVAPGRLDTVAQLFERVTHTPLPKGLSSPADDRDFGILPELGEAVDRLIRGVRPVAGPGADARTVLALYEPFLVLVLALLGEIDASWFAKTRSLHHVYLGLCAADAFLDSEDVAAVLNAKRNAPRDPTTAFGWALADAYEWRNRTAHKAPRVPTMAWEAAVVCMLVVIDRCTERLSERLGFAPTELGSGEGLFVGLLHPPARMSTEAGLETVLYHPRGPHPVELRRKRDRVLSFRQAWLRQPEALARELDRACADAPDEIAVVHLFGFPLVEIGGPAWSALQTWARSRQICLRALVSLHVNPPLPPRPLPSRLLDHSDPFGGVLDLGVLPGLDRGGGVLLVQAADPAQVLAALQGSEECLEGVLDGGAESLSRFPPRAWCRAEPSGPPDWRHLVAALRGAGGLQDVLEDQPSAPVLLGLVVDLDAVRVDAVAAWIANWSRQSPAGARLVLCHRQDQPPAGLGLPSGVVRARVLLPAAPATAPSVSGRSLAEKLALAGLARPVISHDRVPATLAAWIDGAVGEILEPAQVQLLAEVRGLVDRVVASAEPGGWGALRPEERGAAALVACLDTLEEREAVTFLRLVQVRPPAPLATLVEGAARCRHGEVRGLGLALAVALGPAQVRRWLDLRPTDAGPAPSDLREVPTRRDVAAAALALALGQRGQPGDRALAGQVAEAIGGPVGRALSAHLAGAPLPDVDPVDLAPLTFAGADAAPLLRQPLQPWLGPARPTESDPGLQPAQVGPPGLWWLASGRPPDPALLGVVLSSGPRIRAILGLVSADEVAAGLANDREVLSARRHLLLDGSRP